MSLTFICQCQVFKPCMVSATVQYYGAKLISAKVSSRGGVEDTRLDAKAKDTKKIRGQGQGQPFRGQTLSRPRTGMLDAKAKDSLSEDRHSRGQGQECSRPRPRTKDTSASGIPPKKRSSQKFFRRSPEKKRSSQKFFKRSPQKKVFQNFFKSSTKF